MPTFEERLAARQASQAPTPTLSPLEQTLAARKAAREQATLPEQTKNPLAAPFEGAWQRLTETDVPPGEYATEHARRSAVALLGSIGAVQGLRTGGAIGGGPGALAGSLAGGMAGVGLGTFAPEFGMEIAESLGLMPPGSVEQFGRPLQERVRMAKGEMYLDSLFGVFGNLPRFAVGRPLSRAVTKPGKQAPSSTGMKIKGEELAQRAQDELGITLMPWQVGGARAGRAFLSVWGRFPIVSRAAREKPMFGKRLRFTSGQRVSEQQALEFMESVPGQSGGTVRKPYDLSHAIFSDAQGLLKEFDNYFKPRYEAAWDRAEKMGVGVKLDNLRAAALETIYDIRKRAAVDASGDPAIGKSRQEVIAWIENNILKLNPEQKLRGLDEIVSEIDATFLREEAKQNRFLLGQLNKLRGAAIKDMEENIIPLTYAGPGSGLPTTTMVTPGMEGQARAGFAPAPGGPALESIQTGQGEYRAISAKDVADELRDLDRQYSNLLETVFETSTAKKFGRVERRGLRGVVWDSAQTTPIGQLAKITLDMEDPNVVSELFALMRPETRADLLASTLEEGMTQSWKQTKEGFGSVGTKFDTDHFLEFFGFAPGKAARADVIGEMLKQTGSPLDMDTFKLLGQTLDAISLTALPDPSVFMARRAQIGGARAVLTGSLGGLAGGKVAKGGKAVSSAVKGLILSMGVSYFGIRGFIRALSNPAGAKALKNALREEAGLGVVRSNYLRLFRLAASGYADAARDEIGDVEAVRDVQTKTKAFEEAIDKELRALDALSKRTTSVKPPVAE